MEYINLECIHFVYKNIAKQCFLYLILTYTNYNMKSLSVVLSPIDGDHLLCIK